MSTIFDWIPLICAFVAFVAINFNWILECKEKGTKFDSFMVIATLLFTMVGGLLGWVMSYCCESLYNDYNALENDSVPVVESSIENDSVPVVESSINDKEYLLLETLLANGYTLYLNGEVVDIMEFNISDYPEEHYYINNERKEIYLKD